MNENNNNEDLIKVLKISKNSIILLLEEVNINIKNVLEKNFQNLHLILSTIMAVIPLTAELIF